LEAVISQDGTTLLIELVFAFIAGIGATVGFIEGRKHQEQDKAEGTERDPYYRLGTWVIWPIIWGIMFVILAALLVGIIFIIRDALFKSSPH
jgi:hypothetical protein